MALLTKGWYRVKQSEKINTFRRKMDDASSGIFDTHRVKETHC
jgi:hypothetical protein